MSYINHINKYADAQAIQDALDAGTLANPYVAMTSAGTLDYNTLEPTPPAPVVETRIKNTYRVTEEEWEYLSGETVENRIVAATLHGPELGLVKAELPDGTELEYEEGSGVWIPVSGAGDYVVYFTVSGDTIEGSEEIGEGLFSAIYKLVASEIPDNIYNIGYAAYQDSGLESVRIPSHAMNFGMSCFNGPSISSINSGQNLIPAGSVVNAYAFTYGTALEYITIGSGVTFPDMDGYASNFGTDSLTAVTFLDQVPPVIHPSYDGDPGTFNWANIQEIHVPVGYEQDYVDAFNTSLGGEYTFQVAGAGLIEVDPSPSE